MDTMSKKWQPSFDPDGLTARQLEVLGFIRDFITQNSFAPTEREIAEAFGLASKTGPRKHLQALEAAGAISIQEGRARSITLNESPRTRRSRTHLSLPVLGQVAAGLPIGADIGLLVPEDAEVLELGKEFFATRPDYLLRVKGDSMRDAGILNGDLVAIARAEDARNGQIVVARIDGEITIKKLRKSRDGISLIPRNPDYEVIEVGSDSEFAVEGIFCGLVRRG